jgi:hypothetical protein
VGDLAEPLYELMGNEVRASHVVDTDDTISREVSHAPAIQPVPVSQAVEQQTAQVHEIGQGLGIGM